MISAALQAWCEMYSTYGETVSEEQAELYLRTLKGVPLDLLSAALTRVTQGCFKFPLPAHVLDAVDRIRAERAPAVIARRNTNRCEACDGTGWVNVTIRGYSAVRWCMDCRPAPPREQLRSPRTPVFGLEREIQQIAEAKAL